MLIFLSLKQSWRLILKDLFKVSKKFEKEIIFTEWGYEDEAYVAKEPWVMTTATKPRYETMQSNAYRSMFETIWTKPWMKGIFVWRWEPELNVSKSDKPNYSPRFKEAEKILKKWFAKKK